MRRKWPLIGQIKDVLKGEVRLWDSGLADEARSTRTEQLAARIQSAERVTSVCPYCAVGCSTHIYVRDGNVIGIEGNPESPINEGTLCPKGSASYELVVNPLRLTKVLYRRPGGTEWETVSLEWAMERIAQRVKATRDATMRLWDESVQDDAVMVRQCTGIASLGGACLDNEENYLIKKLFAAGLGMIWIENQARV